MNFLLSLLLMIIRQANLKDANDVISMMSESVDKLGRLKYTDEQADAWLAAIPSISRMESMLREPDRKAWVAIAEEDDNALAGYIDWKPADSYLDMLYVHPAFARNGVATLLFQQLKVEIGTGSPIIRTEASEGSRPFFEKQGFRIMERQEFPVGPDRVVIHNYKMTLNM